MQQHRPRIPGEHPAALCRPPRPREPRRHGTRLRPQHGLRLPGLLLVLPRHGFRFRPRRLLLCHLLPARRQDGNRGVLQRQLASHLGRAGPPQHRGLLHPQPAGDLRVPHPGRAPRPGLFPVLLRYRARAAPRPDQPGGPLPLRPLVQRGHVVRRQPQRRRDLRAGETDLPQRRPPRCSAWRCRRQRTGTARSSRRRSTSPRPSAASAGQQRLACPPGWQTRPLTTCPNCTVSYAFNKERRTYQPRSDGCRPSPSGDLGPRQTCFPMPLLLSESRMQRR